MTRLAILALASLGAYLLWQWVKGASLRDERWRPSDEAGYREWLARWHEVAA
jgi:hypothetical protein